MDHISYNLDEQDNTPEFKKLSCVNTSLSSPVDVSKNAPLKFAVAAKLAFPDGSMSASGLRREMAKGHLIIERIAGKGKYYTTLSDIEDMRKLCQINRKVSGCGSEEERLKSASTWIIRDGSTQVRTGCGYLLQSEQAQRKLASYINEKYTPDRQRNRDPSKISLADVLNIYAEDVGPKIKRPEELGSTHNCSSIILRGSQPWRC